MTNEFIEVMSKRTDTELVEILTKYRDDYQPDAISAAEDEFAKRNLTLNQIEDAKQEIEEKDWMIEDKANRPLDTHLKALTFIFPLLINIIIGSSFKVDGYDRKFKELIRWTFYGLGFYFGLFVLILILTSLLLK